MAATSKTQLLNNVHGLLRKRYPQQPRPDRMSVLEAVVYGICHEGTTREQANQALSRFKDEFFDWNEVRVSSLREIQGVLAGLPDTEERARRIRRFLQQLFSKTYSFTLDALAKKPLKEAAKALGAFEALRDDFVLATVVQLALGGHAIPVDVPVRRGLDRLGVADPKQDNPTLRASLERAIPKNRGAEFADLMEELTHDTCVEGEPDCPRCELKKVCPTGQQRLSAAARGGAKKPKGKEKEKPKETAKAAPAGGKTAAAKAPAKKPAAGPTHKTPKATPARESKPAAKAKPKPKSNPKGKNPRK